MTEMSPALARALGRGDARFLMFYADHPEGAARYWTRSGPLRFGGFEYEGMGVLGRIVGGTRSTDFAINRVSFQLRGVPEAAAAKLSGSVRNRVAQVTLGAISRRGDVTIDDAPSIDSILEYQKISVDPKNQTATITLTGYQGFWSLDASQDLAYSDQQQRSVYPDDCGLALLHLLTNRDSRWRSA